MKTPANANEIETTQEQAQPAPKKLCEMAARRAKDLYVVDNFFSATEQRYLHLNYPKFDQKPLIEMLGEFKHFGEDTPYEETLEKEKEIKTEILKWRASLIERNERLETYHMRRLCDTSKEPVNKAVLGAMTRFYRGLAFSNSNQSKFDLFLTRFSSQGTDRTLREVPYETDELVEKLSNLFRESSPEMEKEYCSDKDCRRLMSKFEDFSLEAESYTDFEQIAKNQLFDRLREHKREIGEQIYSPAVSASAVFANIQIGNAFNQLLAEVNPSLNEIFSKDFDLGQALIDSSDEIQPHIDKTIGEIKEKIHETQDNSFAHFLELLENLCVSEQEIAPEKKEVSDPDRATGIDRIAPLIETIGKPEPDRKMLREYMVKYESLDSIDLTDFIVPPEDRTSQLCRSILRVIILGEELRTSELATREEISLETQAELRSVLKRSQQYAESLEEVIEESDLASQVRLRVVSGKLLEIGLKLKHEIIKISERQEEKVADEVEIAEPEVVQEKEVVAPAAREFQVQDAGISRGLVATAIVMVIISGVFFFTNREPSLPEPKSSLAKKLMPSELPNGEHLKVGYKRGSMLFVTAKESWKTMSNDEKRKNLKAMLSLQGDEKLQNVILTDGTGNVLGDISDDGIKFGDIEEESKPNEIANR